MPKTGRSAERSLHAPAAEPDDADCQRAESAINRCLTCRQRDAKDVFAPDFAGILDFARGVCVESPQKAIGPRVATNDRGPWHGKAVPSHAGGIQAGSWRPRHGARGRLAGSRRRARSHAELLRELHDVDSDALSGALENLEALGVVIVEGEYVRVSRAARHLDALGLISV